MKRTIGDFFKREYEIRLSVSSRNVVSPSSDQYKGIALLSPEGDEVFRTGDTAAVEETLALIRELRPEVMRFFADSPDFERWLGFCSKEGISPHIVFSADEQPERLRNIAEQCLSAYNEHGLPDYTHYYEIACDGKTIPFEEDAKINDLVLKMRNCAETLRAADPAGRIILGGLAPIGENIGRSEVWNTALLDQCRDVMDLLGAAVFPSLPSGRTWDENEEGIEANFSMAEEVRNSLQRLERQVIRTFPDSGIRLAVTGWGPLQDDVRQKQQDCVFLSSVYSSLRKGCSMIGLFEAGPLFGKSGLLCFEDGKVFGDVFYNDMLIAADDLPLCLEVKEAEYEKPCPVYHWEGIPGTFGGTEIKMLEVSASRSHDGRKLFLFLTNRTPFRRAVPRIRFYDFSDMHPLKACSLRSSNRMNENSAGDPLNVYCKQVKLRKYRNMDHVTLEIMPCSTVCMVLEP